jgi:cytochrome c oxidase assembly factor CtaG
VRRARYGATLVAVFIGKLPGLLLGVGMTIDAHVWYRSYGSGAHALADQQYAGVVMWVGGGSVAAIAGLVTFTVWMRAMERTDPNALTTHPSLREVGSAA